ncbi:hypothetical protein EDD40_7474 [Saccharothrix texasensis]|uniref:Uncharacterized protein n=2 Tax=Saccharothrix texasensis TaxID=103734 RepID=A0A3N1HHK8_9PSEU|nr:hypothetical protein EDD40_7474 [Saccharothrix texasensis]
MCGMATTALDPVAGIGAPPAPAAVPPPGGGAPSCAEPAEQVATALRHNDKTVVLGTGDRHRSALPACLAALRLGHPAASLPSTAEVRSARSAGAVRRRGGRFFALRGQTGATSRMAVLARTVPGERAVRHPWARCGAGPGVLPGGPGSGLRSGPAGHRAAAGGLDPVRPRVDGLRAALR